MLFAALAVPPPQIATGNRGMVVSDEPLASQIGVEILRKGGNAVDAAVATAFALAVVQPTAGNIGGGGFMLVRMADGRNLFIDYRERAPHRASRDMYLGKNGQPDTRKSLDGLLAGGVPGTVMGMEEASRRFGKLPWRTVVDPACKLAAEGFAFSKTQQSALLSGAVRLGRYEETKRIYLNPTLVRGETVKLPDLAWTLARVRDHGSRDFYRGQVAQKIVADMAARGGLIDAKDLRDYRVAFRKPLVGQFRGDTVYTAPPPSSGGILLLQVLGMLNVKPPEADRRHYLVEAMKRAYADRSEFLGDPDFVQVLTSKLIDKAYLARLTKTISPSTAIPSAQIRPGAELPKEHEQTTHFSVVDAAGNCVSNTYTLNGSFGSGEVIRGTGILLNNEMDDFAAKPGSPNLYGLIQGERNAIQPRKRPLSSMTPTIVVRGNRPILVLGSPGGSTIPNTVINVLTNFLDLHLPIDRAVGAPRLHHQWMPDELAYEDGYPSDLLASLRAKGHVVRSRGGTIGICNAIAIDPRSSLRTGAADRRYGDATAIAE